MPPKQRAPMPQGKGARARVSDSPLPRVGWWIEDESATAGLAPNQPYAPGRPAPRDISQDPTAPGAGPTRAGAARPIKTGSLVEREPSGQVPAWAIATCRLPHHAHMMAGWAWRDLEIALKILCRPTNDLHASALPSTRASASFAPHGTTQPPPGVAGPHCRTRRARHQSLVELAPGVSDVVPRH